MHGIDRSVNSKGAKITLSDMPDTTVRLSGLLGNFFVKLATHKTQGQPVRAGRPSGVSRLTKTASQLIRQP